ncbi:hypothetical protein FACS1894216_14480 [Synergistales bacterium]|nr:hypothetical protein FACS1894216_14480 [Synergistales bacterium]
MRKISAALSAIVIALLCAAFLSQCGAAHASVTQSGGVWIVSDATGFAPVKDGQKNAARQEAQRMAYRDALEKAMGATVTGITEMENFAVTRDKVFSQTQGIVKGFDILSEKVDADGVLTIVAKCKVSATALDGVLGPAVLDTLGNPRVMILIDERINDKTPFISTTESEVQRIFEKAGYLLVDLSQAGALVNLDQARRMQDPQELAEVARTLKADVIITGRAYASAYGSAKVNGVTLYGVRASIQLKSVVTKTAYQLGSEAVEKKISDALNVEDGAIKGFQKAAPEAARSIVYKVAYSLVSNSLGGRTVNIKISNITFKKAQAIEEALGELAGKSGSVHQREFKDGVLEIDVVSEKTTQGVASFLSDNGVEVEGVTASTVNGRAGEGAGEPEKRQSAETPAAAPAEAPAKSGKFCGTGAFGAAGIILLAIGCAARRKRGA